MICTDNFGVDLPGDVTREGPHEPLGVFLVDKPPFLINLWVCEFLGHGEVKRTTAGGRKKPSLSEPQKLRRVKDHELAGWS
jgi:hypothetical protein